jgi:uncharacterized radical SAM superfamily Fe-S cluster-containing enzyme
MDRIEDQTAGHIRKKSFTPPGCENARCSFHGNYILQENNELLAVNNPANCCGTEKADAGANKTKAHVSRKWSGKDLTVEKKRNVCLEDRKKDEWDEILDRINRYSFSLSAMAFQDAWNLDLNRVKDCCIHVVNPKGQLIPFCMYNLTAKNGDSIYRKQ